MRYTMNQLAKDLINYRYLRNAARSLTIEQIETVISKLDAVAKIKRDELAKLEQAEALRKERITKYKEFLKQEGITKEELAEILGQSIKLNLRKKRNPLPPKYQFIDENGVKKTWSGQGRTPKVIQKGLDAGKSLDDFKI